MNQVSANIQQPEAQNWGDAREHANFQNLAVWHQYHHVPVWGRYWEEGTGSCQCKSRSYLARTRLHHKWSIGWLHSSSTWTESSAKHGISKVGPSWGVWQRLWQKDQHGLQGLNLRQPSVTFILTALLTVFDNKSRLGGWQNNQPWNASNDPNDV